VPPEHVSEHASERLAITLRAKQRTGAIAWWLARRTRNPQVLGSIPDRALQVCYPFGVVKLVPLSAALKDLRLRFNVMGLTREGVGRVRNYFDFRFHQLS